MNYIDIIYIQDYTYAMLNSQEIQSSENHMIRRVLNERHIDSLLPKTAAILVKSIVGLSPSERAAAMPRLAYCASMFTAICAGAVSGVALIGGTPIRGLVGSMTSAPANAHVWGSVGIAAAGVAVAASVASLAFNRHAAHVERKPENLAKNDLPVDKATPAQINHARYILRGGYAG